MNIYATALKKYCQVNTGYHAKSWLSLLTITSKTIIKQSTTPQFV
ncbi:hypothetical protein BTN50_0605 [Candidatus Enterovibrio altilux]|uniref:Uncharacterized protein n=1 Tax=Candidatus Enterovibrio altilux TaxID=1927128 RepID=A0A291B830_9GAMM|nr:hypothetical protein BTN50_0605 [Candidatus Enterovibrio luxaltus]